MRPLRLHLPGGRAAQVQGPRTTEEAAVEAAERKALDKWGSVPRGPCPHCYLVLPSGSIADRILFFALLFLFALAVLGLPLVGAVRSLHGGFAKIENLSLVGAGGILVIYLGCLWLVTRHPNRNLASNQLRVQEALKCGEVAIVRPGTESSEARPPNVSGRATLSVIAVVGFASAFLMLLAPAYRLASGLPLNDENLAPRVCSPGDKIHVTLPETITTIDYHWRGEVAAQLDVLGEDRPPVAIPASTQNSTWGTYQFQARKTATPYELWANVQLPDDPSLAGKRVRIHLVLDVTHPVAVGRDHFRDTKLQVHHTQQVNLGSAEAVNAYNRIYAVGVLAGAIITFGLVGGLMLKAVFAHKHKSAVALERLTVAESPGAEEKSEPPPPWEPRP